MKIKNIIFMLLTVIFGIFTYIFIDRGINVRTKNIINYKVDSDIFYTVELFDSDLYDNNNLYMGGTYIGSLVDNIKFNFNYYKEFDENINGYYSYEVTGNLVAYKDDVNNVVWNNEYVFLDDNVVLLNQNDLKTINIKDTFNLDYDRYRGLLNDFIETYGVNLSGYLEVNFSVNESLMFKEINDVITDNAIIKVLIPLSSDTFMVSILDNPASNMSNYYDFSTKERINYLFLMLGALCFSIMVANLFLVFYDFIKITRDEHKYEKELNMIIDKYSNILVKVKRFYNKKKYNLIYLDNFDELMDVYNKVKNPIAYREVVKNNETIFLLTDDENAWIYRMVRAKQEKD